MLSGNLPRSKTDQDRLAKLREAAGFLDGGSAVEINPDPVQPSNDQPAIVDKQLTAPLIVTEALADHPRTSNREIFPEVLPTPSIPAEPIQPDRGVLFGTPMPESDAPFAPFEPIGTLEGHASTKLDIPDSIPQQDIQPISTPNASPPYVGQLDNDPLSMTPDERASDPHLGMPTGSGMPTGARHERVLPSSGGRRAKKSGLGKVLGTTLGIGLLGAVAAGAYVYREPLLKLGKEGMDAVSSLISPQSAEVKEDKASTESQIVKTEGNTEAKDSSRLGAEPAEKPEDTQATQTPEAQVATQPVTQEPTTIVPEPIVEPQTPQTVEVQPANPEPAPTTAVQETPATPAAPEQPATQEGTNTEQPAAQQPIALNGEKAFLYEEALGNTGASRDEGAITWTLANEAPEEGAAPEAVIKAVMDVPSRGLVLNMTIKRNVDAALPASHIIELIFTAPPEFSGGNIDNVSRFVMKATEQARGESLVGVPARIDTGFFLIALNNLDQAQSTNLSLMENANWIDIPVSYVTGRRALMTIDKGTSGADVFAKALADWKNR